ncbi:hypothetical protein F4824DRAFT_490890 [Ustulina deusta]|nr:hypothetical protein F4824DRAFT_490890 [Ustulina deusta]
MQSGQSTWLPAGAPEFAHIKAHSTCPEFVDEVWGFVVYRCAESNEETWNRMLQHIRDAIERELKENGQEGLIAHHDLHVIDDNGVTSHQVREHFRAWASKNLAARLKADAGTTIEDISWKPATFTARYQFCLFIDSVCLESLDHTESVNGLNFPVVKLLDKEWPRPDLSPEERQKLVEQPDINDFEIPEDYADEADVGWMYVPLYQYVEWYDSICRPSSWHDIYVRPPYVSSGDNDECSLPGHWRRPEIKLD